MSLPVPSIPDLPRLDRGAASSHRRWLAFAIVLVALNLRPAIVALAPLLDDIRSATGLSSGQAGMLTALPILCFGLFAPLAPRLSHRMGVEMALLASLVVLGIGVALRLPSAVVFLFAGTLLAGIAMAIGNVLLPAVIKEQFPRRTGVMLGLYSAALSGGAALAAGITVPIEQLGNLGWRVALASWVVPVLLAIAVWAPVVIRASRRVAGAAETADNGSRRRVHGLWSDPTAWHVTAYFAFQSLQFNAIVMWLPTLLRDHGMSRGAAGGMVSIAALVGIVSALIAPTLAAHRHGSLVVAGAILTVASLVGLLLWPVGLAVLWAVLFGLAQGGALSLALSFMLSRTHDPVTTAALAGMSQTVGYLIAAVGPLLLGVLHDATAGWTAALVLLLALLVPQTVTGVLASRPRQVKASVS